MNVERTAIAATVTFATFASTVLGCTNSSGSPAESLVCAATGCAPGEGGADSAAAASECAAAGGQCGTSACTALGPQSCGTQGETCCLDGVGAACAAGAGLPPILASNYDQSCSVDSDCVAIGVGDPCYVCEVACPGAAAINQTSLATYMADTARPVGSPGVVCNCPLYDPSSVCCSAGTCKPHCLDVPAAAGDAGGD
jgi:hypothetical protein